MSKIIDRACRLCLLIAPFYVASFTSCLANSGVAKPPPIKPEVLRSSSDAMVSDAQSLLDQGNYEQAIAKLEAPAAMGVNAVQKYRAQALLSILRAKTGDSEKAEASLSAMEQLLQNQPSADPLICEARGIAKAKQGLTEDAQTNLEKALALYQSRNERKSHQIPVLLDLAHLAMDRRLIGIADDQYELAIQIIEQSFGSKSKLLANVLHERAQIIQSVDGRKAESEQLEARARLINAQIEGVGSHVSVSPAGNGKPTEWLRLDAAGATALGAGRYQEAQGKLEAAVAEAEKQKDPHSTNLLTSLRKLAQCYQGERDWEKAAQTLARASSLMQADTSTNDRDLSVILQELGSMYCASHDPRALDTMRESIKLSEATGRDAKQLEQLIMMFGSTALLFKKFDDAESSFKKLVDMAQSRNDNDAVSHYTSILAGVYIQEGRRSEGLSLMRQVMQNRH